MIAPLTAALSKRGDGLQGFLARAIVCIQEEPPGGSLRSGWALFQTTAEICVEQT